MVMPESLADHVQKRELLDRTAENAIAKVLMEHPELRKSEIPAPLKWAGGIIAALFTAGIATLAIWLVTSVSEMQVTLARMDERMASGVVKDARYDDMDRRVSNLERYHRQGAQ